MIPVFTLVPASIAASPLAGYLIKFTTLGSGVSGVDQPFFGHTERYPLADRRENR